MAEAAAAGWPYAWHRLGVPPAALALVALVTRRALAAAGRWPRRAAAAEANGAGVSLAHAGAGTTAAADGVRVDVVDGASPTVITPKQTNLNQPSLCNQSGSHKRFRSCGPLVDQHAEAGVPACGQRCQGNSCATEVREPCPASDLYLPQRADLASMRGALSETGTRGAKRSRRGNRLDAQDANEPDIRDHAADRGPPASALRDRQTRSLVGDCVRGVVGYAGGCSVRPERQAAKCRSARYR